MPSFLPPWIRPYHIALTVLVLLSALFSSLVRSRKSMTVTIEIPRVWNREETRAKAGDVLEVFELYNRRMRWVYLPLTLGEVQKALYLFGVARGYPDRTSVMRLLDRDMNISTPLAMRRVTDDLCVANAHGYYAPYTWEKNYQSVEHLAMIRACYEWLISRGIEAKPLTLPSYRESYPDLLAVARSEVFNQVFGASHPKGEVVTYVECETGKKSGADAGEKLLKAFRDKIHILAEKEQVNQASTAGQNGPGTGSETGEENTDEKFSVTKALLFILSPELHEAYEALIEGDEKEQEKILGKVKKYTSESRLLVLHVEDALLS
jgi:hypothetical protein